MASRILLADDSITIQKVVNLTFADEGIEVIAVSNGDQAERRLTEVKPDLVLADIFMPGKNGYELCEAIKENSQFRDVPVVLLVGAFEPFDQVEASRVRADAHLTKPFESRTLVETVRRLISASPRTTTGPIAPTPAGDDEREEGLDARAPDAPAAPLASPLAGKLDLSAMMADSNVAAWTPMAGNTGELASPAPGAREDAVDLGFVDALPPEGFSGTLTDASERFESLEFSSNGSLSPDDTMPTFSLDAREEMIQDFDISGPVEPAVFQDPLLCETEASAEIETDISGAGDGGHWFNRSSFDTARLDKPSGDDAWQPPAAGAPLSHQSPGFSLQPEAGFSASEAPTETACGTLLAVDEPLGDVLFDDTVSFDTLALPETPSGDSLGFESTEAEVAEARPAVSTQFDLVEAVADSSQEPLSGFEENVAAFETLTAEDTPLPDNRLESPAPSPLPDAQPISHDVVDDSDWTTPRAVAYSTAQLDSVVMPIDAREYLAENAVDDAPQAGSTEEASFTTPAMWTEEEARFTPIDVEAVSVEEASAGEIGAAETGFAFSSGPAEEPAASLETPVASGANGLTDEAAAAGLSSSAIEEIVRRVVAQMSESVVREVAWEVVPDCVERVIDQLTRESLSKRA